MVQEGMSYHILPVSATMVGVCVTVLTLIQLVPGHGQSFSEKLLILDTIIFSVTCLLSFLSLRKGRDGRYESVADMLFFLGLLVLILSSVLIALLVN